MGNKTLSGLFPRNAKNARIRGMLLFMYHRHQVTWEVAMRRIRIATTVRSERNVEWTPIGLIPSCILDMTAHPLWSLCKVRSRLLLDKLRLQSQFTSWFRNSAVETQQSRIRAALIDKRGSVVLAVEFISWSNCWLTPLLFYIQYVLIYPAPPDPRTYEMEVHQIAVQLTNAPSLTHTHNLVEHQIIMVTSLTIVILAPHTFSEVGRCKN